MCSIDIGPRTANQLPLYLGYISARGPKAVVMNGLPMNLRRKTAIYTYVAVERTWKSVHHGTCAQMGRHRFHG